MSVFFSKKTQQGVYAAEEVKEKTQTESRRRVWEWKWKFLLNQVNPKNAMRSFGTFVSKIDWSKSDSLRELLDHLSILGQKRYMLYRHKKQD